MRLTKIAYTPDEWTPEQAEMHRAPDLDEAFHRASCLSGGWYRRPVTIACRVTPELDEEYILYPSDVPPCVDGFSPSYEVRRLGE